MISDWSLADDRIYRELPATVSRVMFARSMFQTDDMDAQPNLLNRVADLLDDQTIVAPVNQHFGNLTTANLRRALELQDSGTAIGKTVLDGFQRDRSV